MSIIALNMAILMESHISSIISVFPQYIIGVILDKFFVRAL